MTHLLHGARCRDKNERGTNSNFAGIGYLAGGLALVILSASINVRHTIAHAVNPLDATLTGGLALAVTVGFIVLPAIAASAFREGRRGFSTAAIVGAILCGAISLTNIVGASMGQRLTTSVEATDATRKRQDARKLIERREAEVAALAPARDAASVQADIDAKLASRRDVEGCEAKWLPSSGARAVCIEVHRLRAEKATADKRAELEQQIAEARATLNGTAAGQTVGSGDTAAIVAAAGKLGFALDAETVDLLKSIGLALAVELFAALMFIAWERAREASSSTAEAAPVPLTGVAPVNSTTHETSELQVVETGPALVPALECPDFAVGRALAVDRAVAVVPACPSEDASPERTVVEVLTARGGTLLASQRAMAGLFGMSRSSVNRALHELAAEGRVKLVTTAKGTAVTLVEPKSVAA